MILLLKSTRSIFALTLLALLGACSSDGESFFVENPYANDAMWLCKPGISNDQCLAVDLTTRHVLEDGSFETREHVLAQNAHFDCFYVYPTRDLSETPGNTEDLTNIEPLLDAVRNQIARFTSLCQVYAPLYHQMTIGSYDVPGGYQNTEFFERAFTDVDDAFEQYLSESNGRPFVLIGHSQGSHNLIRLLTERFDNNPAMRERLISALLIGPVGALEVPTGETVGGTYQNIPLCTAANQAGCIVAFDSIAAGNAANRQNPNIPCVNPTLLGGSNNVLAGVYLESSTLPLPFNAPEPWVAYTPGYSANCEADGFLGIGDVARVQPPFPIDIVQAFLGSTLHTADVNLGMGDLLRIVETQAAFFN